MSDRAEPGAILERIRDLEVALASCRIELGRLAGPGGGAHISFLEVTPGDGRYLVPVADVREVVPAAAPAPLAGSPPWVMGTIPYGSRTVPVVDLRLRLGGAATTLSPDHLIVVLDSPAWLGLLVTGVGRVLEVHSEELTSPPPDVPSARFLIAAHRLEDGDTLLALSAARLAEAANA